MDHPLLPLPRAADACHGPVDPVGVAARDGPPAQRRRQQPRRAALRRPGHAQTEVAATRAATHGDNAAAAAGGPGRTAAVARPKGGLKMYIL